MHSTLEPLRDQCVGYPDRRAVADDEIGWQNQRLNTASTIASDMTNSDSQIAICPKMWRTIPIQEYRRRRRIALPTATKNAMAGGIVIDGDRDSDASAIGVRPIAITNSQEKPKIRLPERSVSVGGRC